MNLMEVPEVLKKKVRPRRAHEQRNRKKITMSKPRYRRQLNCRSRKQNCRKPLKNRRRQPREKRKNARKWRKELSKRNLEKVTLTWDLILSSLLPTITKRTILMTLILMG